MSDRIRDLAKLVQDVGRHLLPVRVDDFTQGAALVVPASGEALMGGHAQGQQQALPIVLREVLEAVPHECAQWDVEVLLVKISAQHSRVAHQAWVARDLSTGIETGNEVSGMHGKPASSPLPPALGLYLHGVFVSKLL